MKFRFDIDLIDLMIEMKVKNKKILLESCIENCFCEEENDSDNKKDVYLKLFDWIV